MNSSTNTENEVKPKRVYKCISSHPRLTVGQNYTEWANNPNPFNAMVKNDLGEFETFPRKKHFIPANIA